MYPPRHNRPALTLLAAAVSGAVRALLGWALGHIQP